MSSIPLPTIVLFDMDGTTVRHVNPRILGILEFADDVAFKIGKLLHRGARAYDDSENRRKPRLLVHRALHKIRRKPVDEIVQPCPGIYTVLDALRALGIPMGVVSNGLGKGYGHEVLEKFNLSGYFASQTFREDIRRSKPNPEPLLRALKGIREVTESDVIWYIGDRHKDVIAAIAAEALLPARVVPLAYGLNASVAVLKLGLSPDHIVMNYHELTERLTSLSEKKSVPETAAVASALDEDDETATA